jgi:deazaflavin-dependent oxidoreductase (nitroreductase family)
VAESKVRVPPRVVRRGGLARAPLAGPRHPWSQVPLATPPGQVGALRLTTRGRRSGEPRSVIIGYYDDGPNPVAIANGWGAGEPAWWLNLQAHPEAVVEMAGGIRREVLGRVAVGEDPLAALSRRSMVATSVDAFGPPPPCTSRTTGGRLQFVTHASRQVFVNFWASWAPIPRDSAEWKRPCDQGLWWWALEDSNLWPLPRQGSALPLS